MTEISKELSNKLVNPKVYADPDQLNELFATLRKETPFAKAVPDGFEPFWVATKHADLRDIEKRSDVFLAGEKGNVASPLIADHLTRDMNDGEPNLVRSLVAVDGKEHKDLRAILFKSLTPAALKDVEQHITDIAVQYVDEFVAKAPRCDFAKEVGYYYPLRVVMSLLGVPPEDEPLVLRLTQEMFGGQDPDLNRSGEKLDSVEAFQNFLKGTLQEWDDYFSAKTPAYRENPDDSLHSKIANAKIDGEYLTHKQLMGYYIITSAAGHDTTSNTTAAGMWELAKNPELFKRLKENPDDISLFVEESSRYASAVKHFMRSAAEDTTVAGQEVKKGDWIMLSYHSGSRDEDVYDNPDEFNIDRPRNKQIAFGSGPHACLGQHLARLELKIFWKELISRIKSVKLTAEPELYLSTFVIGPKSVPIEFELEDEVAK